MSLRNNISQSIELLSKTHRKKYFFLVILQTSTVALDLVALGLVGIVSRMTLGQDIENSTSNLNHLFGNRGVYFYLYCAIFLFIFKSVISMLIIRKMLAFLSIVSVDTSRGLFDKFAVSTIEEIHHEKSQHMAFTLGTGVNILIVEVLTSWAIFISEVVALGLLMLVAVLINVEIGLASCAYFLIIITIMQSNLRKANTVAGAIRAKTEIDGNEMISQYIFSYREFFTLGDSNQIRSRFLSIREDASRAVRISQWSNLLPKYVLESSLLIGVGLLAIAITHASANLKSLNYLGIFIAIGFRIVPSLLRIQAALNTVRNSSAAGKSTSVFSKKSLNIPSNVLSQSRISAAKNTAISLKGVTFSYLNREKFGINNLNLDFTSSASTALVGMSGSGKSTIADLIAGVLLPHKGSVEIEGLNPRGWIRKNPRQFMYIPQSVGILNGSLIDNICLSLSPHDQDRMKVLQIIRDLELEDLLSSLPNGLDTSLGESAVNLSGGQRQRIGLARSLYFKPKFLVMDESTSALDAETEKAIRALMNLYLPETTKIIIAHKLTLLSDVDKIVFLENGQILREGKFDDLSRDTGFRELFGMDGEVR